MHLPYACMEEDDCSFTPLGAKITGINATVGSIQNNSFTDQLTDSFNLSAIKIEISEIEFSEISSAKTVSFVPTAYACTPPHPELLAKLDGIFVMGESTVFTNESAVEKGQPLNHLFVVTDEDNVSLDDFIDTLQEHPWKYNFIGASFTLALKDQPDQPIDQSLTFNFRFSDGSELVVTTENFKAG